jgi:hypothetical protein
MGAIWVSGGPVGRNQSLWGLHAKHKKNNLVVLSVEALHFGHVYCRTQTSMVSASEDPYEAEEHAVEEHDLEEQPKKK